MKRREVMISILRAAATCAVLSLPIPAFAAPTERTSMVIQKAKAIVRDSTGTVSDLTNAQMDDLLGYILTEYPEKVDVEAANKVFSPDFSLSALNEGELHSLAETVVPIAVMRELIRNRGVRFAHTRVPNWRLFSRRYSAAILSEPARAA